MRAMKIARDEESSQDALRRWTERRREMLLVERIERLAAAVEHLAAAIEGRRAA